MNKRRIQAVINRIEDDIVQYKNEIKHINSNPQEYGNLEAQEGISFWEGRIYEAEQITKKLVMLKGCIND